MKITGTIKDKDGTLPSANIYVSDEFGNVINPIKGTSSDVFTGVYTLDNLTEQPLYITASYVGYRKVTKKISELQGGENKVADFFLVADNAEIPTFELIEERTKEIERPKKHKPLIYVGIGLVAITAGYLTFISLKS